MTSPPNAALPGWLPRRLRGRLLLLMLVAALPALVILLNATFWLRGNAIAALSAVTRTHAAASTSGPGASRRARS